MSIIPTSLISYVLTFFYFYFYFFIFFFFCFFCSLYEYIDYRCSSLNGATLREYLAFLPTNVDVTTLIRH